jgi:hypothetical protein
MRKLVAVIFSLIFSSAGLSAKTGTQEAPQTARQALMEMFFSKEPGTFLKHLPAATRAALDKAGALPGLQQYSMMAGQMQTQGKSLQTFEAGPIFMALDDPKTGQKFAVTVDSDSLNGDQDDIGLSFQTYKDNQPQKAPFMPRIVFSMKTESGVWKLSDIVITVNLPLADPDFLKSITDKMKGTAFAASPQIRAQGAPSQNVAQGSGQASGQTGTLTFGSDAAALTSLRRILAAEVTYAATYPAVGYTCSLSDLDGFGATEANEHQAMLISSGLASGKHQGYSFSLSGCSGTPAASFRLNATPVGESYGRRAFCADQSGAIRSSADGSMATCATSGALIP